jgi:hypothetical protein
MLNIQTFQEGMATLQSVFHTNLDEIKGAAYLQALSHLTDSAFNHAVSEIVLTGRAFPKPVDIREMAATLKIDSTRCLTNDEDRHLPHGMQPKHNESAKVAMQMMFSDKIPREHKLEAFRRMDRAYPGIGWAEEGNKLKKLFDRKYGDSGEGGA